MLSMSRLRAQAACRVAAAGLALLLGGCAGGAPEIEPSEDALRVELPGAESQPRANKDPFLGTAAYAFNAPPGLRYLEHTDVLFRVDPTKTALEAKQEVSDLVQGDPALRGSVEATTGPWSRCMEADLVETTIDSRIRARDLEPPADRPRLRIQPLERDPDDRDGQWFEASSNRPIVRRMGLHPTDWRWRIQGIRPGRTQLTLRLYAVTVAPGKPGEARPECGRRNAGDPDSADRIRTFQRRLAIDVSSSEWVESELPPPWLWTLLLPLLALVRAWWRRRSGRPVLAPGEDA